MKQVNRNQLEQVSGGCFGSKNRPAQSSSNRAVTTAYRPPVSSGTNRQPGRVGV